MVVRTSTGNALIMQLLHLDKITTEDVLAVMTVFQTIETSAGTKTHIGTYHGDEVTLTVYEFDDVAIMHFSADIAFGGSAHFFAQDAGEGKSL